jgi:hypothetical protein
MKEKYFKVTKLLLVVSNTLVTELQKKLGAHRNLKLNQHLTQGNWGFGFVFGTIFFSCDGMK